MSCRTFCLLAFLTMFGRLVCADEIQFKNGNRLTGKILHLTEGKLLFKTDIAGDITIDFSSVLTLSTDEPVMINLKDNTSFRQRLQSARSGWFFIPGDETVGAQEFALSDIVSINPPPKPVPRWTGDLSLNITSMHGNTTANSASGSASLVKRTEKDRTTVNADYAKSTQKNRDTGEEETIEDWWRAKVKYDYFFSKKMYGYVDLRYEKDSIADLDRRVVVGLGSGYQWIETEKTKFSTEAGFASLYEKFENQTESNSEITTQLGYTFETKLRDNIRLRNNLAYYPALKKISDYYLTTTAEVRTDLAKNFFANFKTILDFDSTPAAGAHKTDVKYFFGLGYSF
jgi:putative salt-induced outer membrane protein YdiY